MMPENINSKGQIGVLVQIWPPKRDPKLAPTECHSTGRPHASRMRVTVTSIPVSRKTHRTGKYEGYFDFN